VRQQLYVTTSCASDACYLHFNVAHIFIRSFFITEHVWWFLVGSSLVAAVQFFWWFLDSCRLACCGVYKNSCLLEMKFAMELYSRAARRLKSGGGGSQVPLSLVSRGLFDKPIDQPGGVPLGIHVMELAQTTMACSFGKSAYGSAALVKC
jgi:hypothetical protein